jgi:hypothetical protein
MDDGGHTSHHRCRVTAIGIIVAALIAVCGWFVGNALAARRERRNDRRDYRAKFLIDAWVTLEDAAQRKDNSRLVALEGAVAKIHLFGTARQIELAQTLAREIAEKSRGSTDDLLNDLRRDLRAELELAPVSGPILHVRAIYRRTGPPPRREPASGT